MSTYFFSIEAICKLWLDELDWPPFTTLNMAGLVADLANEENQ